MAEAAIPNSLQIGNVRMTKVAVETEASESWRCYASAAVPVPTNFQLIMRPRRTDPLENGLGRRGTRSAEAKPHPAPRGCALR